MREPASSPTITTARPAPLTAMESLTHLHRMTVLDVRAADEFAAGHLAGGGHVPVADFARRRTELPPREARILVVARDAGQAEAAAHALSALGFTEVHWLDAPLAALEGGLVSREPAVRLWRPAPFLEEVLPLLPRGRAADLAAGAGREAVFLATHGFEVEAFDSDPDALADAAALAARHGVHLATMSRDLEAPDPALPESRYDLIVCFRFLHRPLFPAIERALAPGGYLVYETFRVGQERFGRPRRARFLLEPGELARAFPGLETVRFDEPDPPAGPITSRLLARKAAHPRSAAVT